MAMAFDLGERIKQIRFIQAKAKALEAEYDAKVAPLEDFINRGKAEILEFLNATKQKSANTEFGGTHWKPKVSWRVEDREAFMRHVIGSEAWDLITWAAQPTNCDTFTDEHKMPPPGVVRNSVNIVYITAPVKPRKWKVMSVKEVAGEQEPDELPEAAE